MTEPRKLRVFLCHASQDKPIVREFYQRLLAEGWIDPWLDEEKLLPGQDWDLEIKKAVEKSDAVIVVLSKMSVTKEGYIQKEIQKVVDVANEKPLGTIFLIPLRLEECAVPNSLLKKQWVDYFPTENKEWGYRKILQSLQIRGKETVQVFPEIDKVIYTQISGNVQFIKIDEIEFALVPAGRFLMGDSSDQNSKASQIERPLHEVQVSYDYWMGRYTVTNQQYLKYSENAGKIHKFPVGKENHPVVFISWDDTMDFIKWLNAELKTKLTRGYRFSLPSELEWEKAARGLDGRDYPWGKSFDTSFNSIVEYGSDKCNIDESGNRETVEVNMFSPTGDSPYGIANMSGNVWEWTRSLWFKGNDAIAPKYVYPYNPKDGREDLNVDGARILRGGSFFNGRWQARCASRAWDFSKASHKYLGFRVAITPE